jgi:hypothetical protein
MTSRAQTASLPDAPKPAQQAPQPPTQAKPANLSTKQANPEDWTVLPLAKSGLAASGFNAALLGKYEQPEYTRELLRVQWRPDDPIDLYVVLPHGVTRPPVILYLYDYHFDTDRFRNDAWCKQATQGGFAAAGFGSAFSLQRHHAPRPMREWFVSELQEALGTSTHDVQMVLNYLASRGDVDVSKAGIYGQGSGGAIAVLAAEADPRIAVLDLLNPWGDWPDWLKGSPRVPEEERADYLKPEFLQKVSGLDPVTYMPHLKLKGVRIQQLLDDTETPLAARDKIAAAAPGPDDVVHYKDITAHRNAWRKDGLTGWISVQLRSSAEVITDVTQS